MLSIIPLKDWIYLGIIVVGLIAFEGYRIHLEHLGAAKVEAADAKAVAAQVVHNNEVQNRAQALLAPALESYKQALAAIPAVAATPHVVCQSPRRGPVSSNASPRPASPSPAGTTAVVAPAVDIGPDVTKRLADSDALVKALQEYIHTCQAEGLCKK